MLVVAHAAWGCCFNTTRATASVLSQCQRKDLNSQIDAHSMKMFIHDCISLENRCFHSVSVLRRRPSAPCDQTSLPCSSLHPHRQSMRKCHLRIRGSPPRSPTTTVTPQRCALTTIESMTGPLVARGCLSHCIVTKNTQNRCWTPRFCTALTTRRIPSVANARIKNVIS